MNEDVRVLISVIVVTYNVESIIGDTLKSLLSQNLKNYEVIFVDGGSNDGTVSVLNKFAERFKEAGIKVKTISEPDEGIYDAMNKGILIAEGTYGYFLNAGDLLNDGQVFESVLAKIDDTVDIVYGDTIDDYGYKKELLQGRKIEDILFAMPFCHQAVFTKMLLLKQYLYDKSYCYCADYDMYLRMYLDKRSFVHLDRIIVIYSRNGVSSNNTVKVLKQYKAIQKNNKVYSLRQAWQYIYRISLHELREVKHRLWRQV